MDENNKPVQPAPTPNATPSAAAPAPQAMPTAQPVTPATGVPSGKKKRNIIIGAIIAVIVLAAAIAYGVYAYMTNQPDYMLGQALQQISKQEALAAKFKVVSGTGSNVSTITGDVAGREDKAAKAAEAVIGIGSGDSRVTLTARTFEDTTYMRLGSLNNVPNLVEALAPGQEAMYETAEFKSALGRINDKWFSLTKEEAAGLAQGATSTTANGFNPQDFQKAAEIYNRHPFFKADKSFADETIDNVNTAHFSIKIDRPTYKAFLTDLKAANVESLKPSDSDIANSDKDADDFAKSVAVEFWIARDTKKFKQMKFVGLEQGNESEIVLTLVSDLPNFGKLEKPADAASFNEFMTLFIGASFGPGLDVDSGMTEEEMNQ
jgi:hypothetical protein